MAAVQEEMRIHIDILQQNVRHYANPNIQASSNR